MDVVLELFDAFACDYLYAKAFPIATVASPLVSKLVNGSNATEAINAFSPTNNY
ncbi:hypothetical protein KEM55_006679, partial [Ascosphaera atra]